MTLLIWFAFKTVKHIDHLGEPGLFKRHTCINRTQTTAANQKHGLVPPGGDFLDGRAAKVAKAPKP